MKRAIAFILAVIMAASVASADGWLSMNRTEVREYFGAPFRSWPDKDEFSAVYYTDFDALSFYYYDWGGVEGYVVVTAEYMFDLLLVSIMDLFGAFSEYNPAESEYIWNLEGHTIRLARWEGATRLVEMQTGGM